jgi:hypothetical protein
LNVPWIAFFLAGIFLFEIAAYAQEPAKPSNPQTSARVETLPATPTASWQDSVIKAIAGGGLSLVSLSFAGFTFLYGARLGLRDENRLDARVQNFKRKLAGAIYGTAIAVGCASTLVVLAFISLISGNKSVVIATMCLAVVILLGLSSIAWTLAIDLFLNR